MKARRNRLYGSDMEGLFLALDRKAAAPWLLGPTVESDGVQLKATLMTVRAHHPGPSGFTQLNKAGYQLAASPPTKLERLLRTGVGVHNVKAVVATAEEVADVTFTSIDPGQVRIIEHGSGTGSEWRRDNARELMSRAEGVSGRDYAVQTLAAFSNETEKRRRGPSDAPTPYGAALALPQKKVYSQENFRTFCEARASVEDVMAREIMDTEHRSLHRFYRFIKTQSVLAKMAEAIVPGAGKGGKRVIIFGNGTFSPCKGAASAPRKKLVAEFACRAVTLIAPEAYTSSSCPGCLRKVTQGDDYRTRRCETAPGSRPCSLHPDTPSVEFDRDAAGYTNIGIRAVEMITGVFNGVYRPLALGL
jgi:hypothetical protein